jgi:type I restriction enzyme M protein
MPPTGRRLRRGHDEPAIRKKSSIRVVNEEGDQERQSLTAVRDDFWASTTNKQLYSFSARQDHPEVSGRAAVIVPDNVLFEGGAGETVRKDLSKNCDVHTLLRLPPAESARTWRVSSALQR